MKRRWKIRNNSIFVRVFSVIVILSLTQISIFSFMFAKSHIIDRLKQSKLDVTANIAETRTSAIENKMINTWTNLNSWETAIERLDQLHVAGDGVENMREEAGVVLALLEKSMTTGAFYVKLDPVSEGVYDVLYFKDENPDTYSLSHSDVFIEYGKASVGREFGTTMDSNWKAFADEALAGQPYIQTPVEAYEKNAGGEPKDYGYWSVGELPYNKGVNALMYTVPLFDENGRVYGVLGVEVTLEYIGGLLKFDELTLEENSAYVLAHRNRRTNETVPVVAKGHNYSAEVRRQGDFELVKEKKWANVYHIDWMGENELVFKNSIHTYQANTPFVNEEWCLLAIQNANALFYSEEMFARSMNLIQVLIVLLGVIGSFIASSIISRPIRRVTSKISQMGPDKLTEVHRVHIDEIDALLDVIRDAANSLTDATSRFSNILKAAQLSVGVIEMDSETEECYVTAACFELLGFGKIEENYLLVTQAEVDAMMEEFCLKSSLYQVAEPAGSETESIYEVSDGEKAVRWVSFVTRYSEKKKYIVVSDATESVLRNIRLEYEANHDYLSKLYNIKAFRREVELRIKAEKDPVAILAMWDLDNLKYINDNYGHKFGDSYIRATAKCLSRMEEEGGVVARRSGDEFFVFLTGKSRGKLYEKIFELHLALQKTEVEMPDGQRIKVRASAGVAWYLEDAKTYAELVKRADFAMYSVKRKSKGVIQEFDAKDYEWDEILLSGSEELNRLIEERLIAMAYQPIVDVSSGEVYAYEALMRPKTERFKTPLDVIRIAKSQARLGDLEILVWETVLDDYFYNKGKVRDNALLFVNSFPNAILPDYILEKNEALYHRFFHEIVTEITEEEETDERFMERKRYCAEACGSRIALDDYGSGFNSEIKLLQLHPAFVKIDRIFVNGIPSDLYRQEMVKNVIGYCKMHGIRVIAEGVETEEELAYLIEEGVDYVQGFYLARPAMQLLDEQQKEEIRRKVLEAQ